MKRSTKPIPMLDCAVKSLLAGRKTQHRTVLKPQPFIDPNGNFCAPDRKGRIWNWGQHTDGRPCVRNYIAAHAPYAVGDRLWVREAHALLPSTAYRMSIGTGTVEQREHPADGYTACVFREGFDRSGRLPWRSSTQMPRWASRLTLIVTDVRVQRLQEISEDDAVGEGIVPFRGSGMYMSPKHPDGKWRAGDNAYRMFAELWNSLNGPGAWERNDWVAATSFEFHKANIDALAEAA